MRNKMGNGTHYIMITMKTGIHKKIIKPFKFSISLNKPFNKIVEIPINVRNKKIIKNFLTEGEFKRYFPN